MECVVCGGTASNVFEATEGRYRDEVVAVEGEFFRCSNCEEEFFTPEQAKAHTRAVKNEIRKKYGLLPPEKIVDIRKQLRLTQEQLEELLGVGSKTVVRWESGKVIHTTGHDNMLRLLERDPGLMEDLRQIQKFKTDEQQKYEKTHKDNPGRMIAQAQAV
jgi:HTH-type transcriptional regulator / antitoxin MqsA